MRVLLRFSCGFVGAAAAALLLLRGPLALVMAGLLLAAAVPLCLRRRGLGPILLGLALGMGWTWGYETLVSGPRQALAGTSATITATAVDYSQSAEYGLRVPARLTSGERAVVWLSAEEPLKPGDRFTVRAQLKAPEGEQASYYHAEGYDLMAFGRGQAQIQPASAAPLRYLPRRIAHQLESSLRKSVPQKALGYALALTTGNRTELTPAQKEDLQRAGIYHALALSGMHMTVLMSGVTRLFRRKRARALVGIPLCAAFAGITGASPSIVRAAVMECLMLAAPVVGREEDAPTSLGAAALLLTAQNPWCVLGWGMQLSFASMAGLIWLERRVAAYLPGRGRAAKAIRDSLAATLSASLATMPLMMVYFGRISLVAPLTNLLAGWAVSWCFRGSLLTALVGLLPGPLGGALGWCLGWCVRYVQAVAGVMAGLPFAAVSTHGAYGLGWTVMLYGMLLAWAAGPEKWRRAVLPGGCGAAAMGAVLLLALLEQGGCAMTVLDVGQGQCLLFSGAGQTVMVDCGGSSGPDSGLLAAAQLADMGEDRVDALILTHFDQDHTGGVETMLDRVKVDQVLMPDMEPEHPMRLTLETLCAEAEIPVHYVSQRAALPLRAGEVTLYPPEGNGGGNCGLSLLVRMGRVRTLVTGDMDAEAEHFLLRRQTPPEVDILVAGHHGSGESTSWELLETVRPETVVISVGKNHYGHPAEETLARIRQWGARVYRTDEYGTLTLKGA